MCRINNMWTHHTQPHFDCCRGHMMYVDTDYPAYQEWMDHHLILVSFHNSIRYTNPDLGCSVVAAHEEGDIQCQEQGLVALWIFQCRHSFQNRQIGLAIPTTCPRTDVHVIWVVLLFGAPHTKNGDWLQMAFSPPLCSQLVWHSSASAGWYLCWLLVHANVGVAIVTRDCFLTKPFSNRNWANERSINIFACDVCDGNQRPTTCLITLIRFL